MAFPPGASCSISASTAAGTVIGPGVTSASGLPAGLSFPGLLGPDFIDGTPTGPPGFYNSVINGLSCTFQVTSPGPNWAWTPDTSHVNTMTVGVPSTLVLTPTGSPTGAVTFGMTATVFPFCTVPGSMPPGLTFQSNGHVTGTPTLAGIYAASIYGVDTLFRGQVTTNGLQITVFPAPPPPLAASCASPTDGLVGTPYIHLFVATGGTPPYSFTSFGGEPPGLTLASDGTLSGTPTTPGTFSLDMRVNDFAGDGPLPLTCSIVINNPSATTYTRHGVLQGFADNTLGAAGVKPNQFENWDNFNGNTLEDQYIVGAPTLNSDPSRIPQINPANPPYLGNEFNLPFAIPIGVNVTITLVFDGPVFPTQQLLTGWIMPDGNPGDSILEFGPFVNPSTPTFTTVWHSTVSDLLITVGSNYTGGVVNWPYTITISIPGGGGGGTQVALPSLIAGGGSGQQGFGV